MNVSCGSLFSGIGLLDAGLHRAGWHHAWLCESDDWRRDMLRRRFPDAIVYDDVRTMRGPEAASDTECGIHGRTGPRDILGAPRTGTIEGPQRQRVRLDAANGAVSHRVPPVDLIAGGFPCKGASTAGKREGFEHAETVLWHEMRRVISEVGPRYVLIENVAAILGMAAAPGEPAGSLWGTVLRDLAALGFDVVWDCIPAAAVGAPHLRDRVFAVATQPACADTERNADQRRQPNRGTNAAGSGPWAAADAASGPAGRDATDAARRRREAGAQQDERPQAGQQTPLGDPHGRGIQVDWGDYQPAITRWETIHGPAPKPLIRRLDDGDAKLQRLRARMDRSRLSALGDGVHVYIGWIVGEYVMALERERCQR